ncbi:MAG: ABC transporter permease subunit [Planctomycetes bacterium]|nr:ABC transporter permease subunit [Planctomycetota bacterium]
MTRVLVLKLLRDVRWGLVIVSVLLCLFQLLWAKVTDRIAAPDQLLESFLQLGLSVDDIRKRLFSGPGQIVQALMGGESIRIERALDMISISYVHPLTQIILCVWAIGRAAGAIAGEIDKGTMELLLAQPVARSKVIAAHLVVDAITIPILCLSMWLGTWIGVAILGFLNHADPNLQVNPWRFGPALLNVALLVFAVSGLTMWISSMGRFRWRVLGVAVLVALVMFLVNVIGQIWDPASPLRPATIFYYYQPQPMILQDEWFKQAVVWERLGVLLAVGSGGYLLAWWTFCKRDLPAPL